MDVSTKIRDNFTVTFSGSLFHRRPASCKATNADIAELAGIHNMLVIGISFTAERRFT